MTEIQLDKTSSILFDKNFLTKEDADELFQHMQNDIVWSQSQITMFGKQINIPRLQSWMSDPGVNASLYQKGKALPWSNIVKRIKVRIEKLTGKKFNYVLLNYYRDGNDSISWHSDGEAVDDDKNTVASISVGETRNFCIKPKNSSTISLIEKSKMKFSLSHGSLIVMQGDMQKGWVHSVPKQPSITKERFNLTFRIA